MRIITVNILRETLKRIEKLVGDDKLYPSRSELCRVALRRFFEEEMKIAKRNQKKNVEIIKEKDEEYIKLPKGMHKILREA